MHAIVYIETLILNTGQRVKSDYVKTKLIKNAPKSVLLLAVIPLALSHSDDTNTPTKPSVGHGLARTPLVLFWVEHFHTL